MRPLETTDAIHATEVKSIEGYHFSAQQRHLYFLAENSAGYCTQCAISIEGSLEVEMLSDCLQHLVSRHEILRTVFRRLPGMDLPLQVVLDDLPVVLSQIELDQDQTSEEQQRQRVSLQFQRQREQLNSSEEVLQSCLLRLPAQKHVLILTLRGLCGDVRTAQRIAFELAELYRNHVVKRGQATEEPVQYGQFCEWQRELLSSEEGEPGRQYWRQQQEQLQSSLPLSLPCEHKTAQAESEIGSNNGGPATRASSSAKIDVVRLGLGTEELTQAEGNNVEATLLAVWQALLWRVTEETAIVVNVAFDGRKYEDLYECLGLFTEYIPIRTLFHNDFSLDHVVRRVSESYAAAAEWQEYYSPSFWTSAKEAESSNRVGFEYLHWSDPPPFADLTLRCTELYSRTEHFKIKLTAIRREHYLQLDFEYDSARYDRATVERLGEEFLTLLRGAIAARHQPLSNLRVPGPIEREQLLYGNYNEKEYPRDKCIHHLFESQVRKTPDAVALVAGDGSMTFGELNRRANQLAHYLVSRGAGPESLVGVCFPRSVDLVTSILAVLKAGAGYVPLSIDSPTERLHFMLRDARAKFVLTQQQWRSSFEIDDCQVICVDAEAEELAQQISDDPVVEVVPENTAYVTYTSGSTGLPKGVVIAHGSVVHLWTALSESIYANQPSDLRVAVNANITFDASVKQLVRLLSGNTLCLLPDEVRADPAALKAFLPEQSVDVFDCTPSQLRQLIAEALSPRLVLVGGEEIDEGLWEEMRRTSGVQYYNLYGPTECTVDVTVSDVAAGNRPNIGRPLNNVQVYILDQQQELAPFGVTGELYVGGPGLARGYLQRPDLTAERFVPHPFSAEPGARLYRTGDLCRYLADGQLEFIGRTDQQVKLRGYRIELGEIEELLREHPSIKDAAVSLYGNATDDKRLVAYVIADTPDSFLTEDLRDHLSQKLPAHMIPSDFVALSSFPLTAHGKLDRAALPAPDQTQDESAIVLPHTPVEELLVNLFMEVLHVERVSVQDNFFELGGHSLLATQLVSRIRDVLNVEVSLRALFEQPTVAGLAENVEKLIGRDDSSVEVPALEPVSRNQPLPLSFAEQRLWFIDQLTEGRAFYNNPMAIRLAGELCVPALKQTFAEITRRHEVLRTHFEVVDEHPARIIDERRELPLTVADLSGLTVEQSDVEIEHILREEARRPFDLASGPMLRVKLMKRSSQEHVLLFTMHHIIADAWSINVLVNEVAELYQFFRSGLPSPLEELRIQYADYAVWQKRWLTGKLLEEQLAYWRRQLAGEFPAVELPPDHVRSALQSYSGRQYIFTVPPDVTTALEQLCRREGVTLFMATLAAFRVLLMRYTGEEDIVVGTDIANRTRGETEALIGFFINQLVLRSNLSGNPSFVELLKREREVCLGAYVHQEMPFEKLVEQLAPQRSLSQTPLFQIKFLLHNEPAPSSHARNLRVEPLNSDSGAARFDLTVALGKVNGILAAAVQYSDRLYERATIERFFDHYKNLLAGIVADPTQRISTLPLLSATEKHNLLAKASGTRSQPESELYVHKLFEEQVARTPDAVALINNGVEMDYAELNRKANQLAHYLMARGVGPEVLVGLCLPLSTRLVIAVLAILKTGAAYVPLDSDQPLERLSWLLEDSNVPLLLTEESLAEQLPAHWGNIIYVDTEWDAIVSQKTDNPAAHLAPLNTAYVIYTSGSTGRPKGVMVSHQGLANYLNWCIPIYTRNGGRRALLHTSLGFDLTVTSLFAPLLTGQELQILSDRRDFNALAKALTGDEHYSFIKLTPAHLALLGAQLSGAKLAEIDVLVVGGENLTAATVDSWRAYAPDTRVINEYGPAETVVGSCAYEVGKEEQAQGSIPIGTPITNTDLYILDQRLELAPFGVTGELYIGGPGLARGYLQRPDLTAERFVPHPFSAEPGARLYRTGDLCRYLADGQLEFIGRIDQQVKLRGYRIELGEIEAVLQDHLAVQESVVLLREDVPGDKRLVAYVRPQPEADLTPVMLREYLREKLPDYMVPAAFVLMPELPLTHGGKIDRAALPPPQTEPSAEFELPRTPIEELLVSLWKEVLHVEQVSIHDSFFELGGHSLLATQLVSRIRDHLQLELPLRSVFDYPTVAETANILEEMIIDEVGELSEEEAIKLLGQKSASA